MDRIKHLVSGLKHICVVVEDMDEAVRHMVNRLGIGPWAVWTYGPHNLSNTKVRDVPVEFSMRLALAWSEKVSWEIIQPLSGASHYEEFLRKTGGGIHHFLAESHGDDYRRVAAEMRARGCIPLMEGRIEGPNVNFSYFDLGAPTNLVVEINNQKPETRRLPPDYWYPYAPNK